MARDYARIRVSINGDDEFEALPADAQWLYTRVLLTHPDLSLAGIVDWRPKRLVGKAADMGLERLTRAAEALERDRFVLFDLETEEALVRTYIRNDELLRNPKMAAAVVKAYGSAASKSLRAAIVTEVKRVRSESPEFSSWTHKDTAADLTGLMNRPDAETVGYANAYVVPNSDARAVTNTNGITNRNGDPDPGTDNQPDNQSNSVPIPCSPQPYSLTASSHRGLSNRGTSPEPTAPNPNGPQTAYCPKHPDGSSEPCGACADVRRSRENRDRANSEQQRAQRESEQQAALEAKLAAIAVCGICDSDGYDGTRVCDHIDRTEVARAGAARARAALENPSAATG